MPSGVACGGGGRGYVLYKRCMVQKFKYSFVIIKAVDEKTRLRQVNRLPMGADIPTVQCVGNPSVFDRSAKLQRQRHPTRHIPILFRRGTRRGSRSQELGPTRNVPNCRETRSRCGRQPTTVLYLGTKSKNQRRRGRFFQVPTSASSTKNVRDESHMSSRGRTLEGETTTVFSLGAEALPPGRLSPFSIVTGTSRDGNAVNTGTFFFYACSFNKGV